MAELPKSDPKNPPSVDPKTTNPSNPNPGPDIPGSLGTGVGAPPEAAGTEPSGNSAPSTVPLPMTASATAAPASGPKPTHPNPNYPDQQLAPDEIEAQKPKTPEEASRRTKDAEAEVDDADEELTEAEESKDENRIAAAKVALEVANAKLDRVRGEERELGDRKSRR